MREKAKRTFLVVCKWLGLFALARWVTRSSLRILCYHGFALSDESSFRPKLFMRPETFQRRMEYISAHDYPVVSLDKACDGLSKGELPPDAVAITVDDGFYGFFCRAWPILKVHSLPATVYVASYYSEKRNPVFRLVVQYLFWKTLKKELDVTGLGTPLSGVLPLWPEEKKDEAISEIIEFAETQLKEPERRSLATELGERLGIGYAELAGTRTLSIMTPEEIRNLASLGVDIQLHTHRHRLPQEQDLLRREIEDNREFLEPLAGKRLTHLCYPSGIWSKQQWPWLDQLGIASATTCDPGLNYPKTPRLGLRRFLDGENVSQIEFEAELCGFAELLRLALATLRRAQASQAPD
jgi:peptidoglycan/xylan/chitin deacetylase (PgdA/CDA1 family)